MDPPARPKPEETVIRAAALARALRVEPGDPIVTNPALPRVPGYRLLRLIGEGSGGQVFEAVREGGSQMPVALKIIRQPLGIGPSRTNLPRVWRELDVLSEMRLPCVPRVLDYGTCEGRLYIATELVEGACLEVHCHRHTLDLRARIELLARVCDAVSEVHNALVLHRDLKPSNILVDVHGNVMIVDFGVARLAEPEPGETLTMTGEVVGTTPYMAPEVAAGDKSALRSMRADVYALGASAYVILTGHPPRVEGDTTYNRLKLAVEGATRDPRTLDRNIPKPLAWVLMKACERRAENRYASAKEFGEDLERFLKGRPVRAGRSLWVRGTEWTARHPMLTFAIAVAAMAGAGVGGAAAWTSWYYQRPFNVIPQPSAAQIQMVSRSGYPLYTWQANEEGAIVFAGTAITGSETIGVASLGSNSDDALAGHLFMFRLDDPQNPFYVSGVTDGDFTPPAPREGPSRDYRVTSALIANVFDDPGDEVIAAFQHFSDCRTCVRVYSARGNVLYEGWHLGRVKVGPWVASTQVLMLAGVSNHKKESDEVSKLAGIRIYPVVALGIRPRSGVVGGWVDDPRPGVEQVGVLQWRRQLRPLDANRAFADARIEQTISQGTRDKAARLHVMGTLKGEGLAIWTVRGDGTIETPIPTKDYEPIEKIVPLKTIRWESSASPMVEPSEP